MRLTTNKTLKAGIVVVILAIVAVLFVSIRQSQRVRDTSKLVAHTQEVLLHIQKLVLFGLDNETGARGYALSGDSKFLEPITRSKKDIYEELAFLKKLTTDNPVQQIAIDSFDIFLEKRIDFSQQVVVLRQQKGLEAAAALVMTGEGKFYTDQIRRLGDAMQQEEARLLEKRKEQNEKTVSQLSILLYGTLAIVFLLGVYIINRVTSDLTERRLFEEQLLKLSQDLELKVQERTDEIKTSEERYRYLFENNPMPMWVMDLETFAFLDINEMAVLQYGYSRDEFLSMTAIDIRPEEDRELFKNLDHSFSSSRENYKRGIWNHMKKDGSIIQVEIIAHKILFEGRPARFILANDITERQKAEEKLIKSEELYRNLFENILHGFAYCKAIFEDDKLKDYIYLAVNKEYEELTGLRNLVGKKVSELVPDLPGRDPEYAEIVKRVVQTGKPERFETWVEAIGKWFSISMYSPENGYFVSLTDDITERKKAEQEIKKINEELEQRVINRTEELKKSNDALEAFSYSVSHDLRAPLRGIIGFSAILEEEYAPQLDDEARRVINIIKKNTSKMGQLIDDLLGFSRMSRQTIEKSDINTDTMVRDVVNELDDLKNIDWKIQPLPAIRGDANTIRQVWINLISNAIKYSRNANKPAVEIGSLPGAGSITFFVKDNGVGFDSQYKSKLFKVFQRLHAVEEFEGTGVGLAIVEKIISKHGGKVWAEGEQNKGATFYFSLPAA